MKKGQVILADTILIFQVKNKLYNVHKGYTGENHDGVSIFHCKKIGCTWTINFNTGENYKALLSFHIKLQSFDLV